MMTTTDTTRTPVLTLDGGGPRDRTITINGAAYALHDPAFLGLAQKAFLDRQLPVLGGLLHILGEGLGTDDDAVTADTLARRLAGLATDAPEALLDRLAIAQIVRLVNEFVKRPAA